MEEIWKDVPQAVEAGSTVQAPPAVARPNRVTLLDALSAHGT